MGSDRQHQVLCRDVLVAEIAHLLLGVAQDLNELTGPTGGLGATGAQLRKCVEARRERLANGPGVDAELAQYRCDDATILLEQHREQVLGRRLRVAPLVGQPLRGLKRLAGLDCESV